MDQDNQKNLLLAIVLSVGVLLVWQVFYAGPKLKDDQERRQRIQQEQSQVKGQPGGPTTAPTTAPGTVAQPGTAVPSAAPLATAATRDAAIETEPARAHRDAEPARLDLACGRTHRRSGAGQVPRDGRSQIAQRRALLALGCAASLLRRVRLGGGRRRDAADARPRHGLARGEGGAADAELAGDAGRGTTGRGSSSAGPSRSTPTICSP